MFDEKKLLQNWKSFKKSEVRYFTLWLSEMGVLRILCYFLIS